MVNLACSSAGAPAGAIRATPKLPLNAPGAVPGEGVAPGGGSAPDGGAAGGGGGIPIPHCFLKSSYEDGFATGAGAAAAGGLASATGPGTVGVQKWTLAHRLSPTAF